MKLPKFLDINILLGLVVLLAGICVLLLLKLNITTNTLTTKTQRITQLESALHTTRLELDLYRTTEQELIELGATSEQAHSTIQAAEVYNIDPKH